MVERRGVLCGRCGEVSRCAVVARKAVGRVASMVAARRLSVACAEARASPARGIRQRSAYQ